MSKKIIERWLLATALEKVRRNDCRTSLIKGMKPGKLTQSDSDTLNYLLFGTTETRIINVENHQPTLKAKS